MENRERVPAGFDERSALAELERLREEIERYRAKRKAVSEEFEEFVRSFKTPAGTAVPQPPRVAQPLPRPGPEPEERLPGAAAVGRSEETAAVAVAPTAVSVVAPAAVTAVAPATVPAVARRASWKTPALLAGALTLLAGGGWITWIVKSRAPHDAARPPAPDRQPVAPSASQAAPAPSPARPEALISELTTSRPVWVRVIADGARIVERELPANARIPLTAQKTIVIRAGNAGAVRVTLAGQDQGVFGPEGTAVTRTFTVPRTPPRD
jgi:hypothetical protein